MEEQNANAELEERENDKDSGAAQPQQIDTPPEEPETFDEGDGEPDYEAEEVDEDEA